jgi:ABC-type sugar transport system ATPase subunit
MLNIRNLSRKLGEFSLNDISIDVADGEYFVLLGRSGSGKTQLLELLAGLGQPDSGTIIMDGRDITRLKPQSRDIGLVFQDFAVFPHMTTYENIAFPLRVRKVPEPEIADKVAEIAGKMDITHLLRRRAINLSGGELQRTALARTLVISPGLLLLDEPLSSIDASLKDDIAKLLRSINRSGQTIIHVTHDYAETIGLATSVGVIHDGRIIQIGTPAGVFNHPVNKFVARYTGIRNFFRVHFVKKAGVCKCLTENGVELQMADGSYPDEGLIVVRNENVHISSVTGSQNAINSILGIVTEIVPTPAGVDIEVMAGEHIFASIPSGNPILSGLHLGSDVFLTIEPQHLVFLRGPGNPGSDQSK